MKAKKPTRKKASRPAPEAEAAVAEKKPAAEEAKETNTLKNDKILIVSILVLVILFGTIFYFIKNYRQPAAEIPESQNFNGFTFNKLGNVWVTNLQLKDKITGNISQFEVMFHYTPAEVQYISTEKDTRNISVTPYLILNTDRIYITTDPDYPSTVVLGGVEIAKILASFYQKEVKSGLTKNSSNKVVPIITCENITSSQRVIFLKLGNETSITSQSGCIVVQGKTPTDVVKASERLTYELLKIL